MHGAVTRRQGLHAAAAIALSQVLGPQHAGASALGDTGGQGPAVLVTGASSGIGRACAEALVARGCEVILGCRTPEQAQREQSRLAALVPGAQAVALSSPLELTDLAGVSAFAAEARDRRGERLSGLLLCAGVDGIPVERTAQGLESHMAINHLSGFLLAAELRRSLEPSAGRVVTLTSSAALDAPADALSDINWERRRYDRRGAYCVSKAACTLMADELARRGAAGGLTAVSVDPGPCATAIVRYAQPQRARQRQSMSAEQLAKQAAQLGMRTPEQGGALPTAMVLGAPGPSGEAFVNGGMYMGAAAPPGAPVPLWGTPEWRTEALAASVWEQSAALVGRWASADACFS